MAVTQADIPKIARDAAGAYKKWGALINKYHGGVPQAMMAVRTWVETNGRMIMAPSGGTLKEVGLFAVTHTQEERFGLQNCARCDAEGNVWIAALRYNVDTAIFLRDYPGLTTNLPDAYIFGSYLISGIGIGAATYLLQRSPRGITYKQFADWVESQYKANALPREGYWGGQSLETIVYRVRAFQYMYEAAELLQAQYGISNLATPPVVPPKPSGIPSFRVPLAAKAAMQGAAILFPVAKRGVSPWVPAVVGVGVTGLLIFAVMSSRSSSS